MPLPQFLTWWKMRSGRLYSEEEKKEKKKKKKKKSLRDVKFIRHGQTEQKKRLMDEIGNY